MLRFNPFAAFAAPSAPAALFVATILIARERLLAGYPAPLSLLELIKRRLDLRHQTLYFFSRSTDPCFELEHVNAIADLVKGRVEHQQLLVTNLYLGVIGDPIELHSYLKLLK
ncbi:hypothetical protein ACXKTX_23250 [Burkholderia gladioli]